MIKNFPIKEVSVPDGSYKLSENRPTKDRSVLDDFLDFLSLEKVGEGNWECILSIFPNHIQMW